MAASSGAPPRQPRRGPAPIASFDHDVSDEQEQCWGQHRALRPAFMSMLLEQPPLMTALMHLLDRNLATHLHNPSSSPESKQAFRLPEIREDPASSSCAQTAGDSLAPPEQRARSHSTPAAGLHTPAAPRIDISRASSSSHHDSRDSSPELALFAGTASTDDARGRLELGFREDGALDLRSSTEELAFLEGAPGEPRPGAALPPPAAGSRRHSRKDSQGSEAALLAVSGRTSRLSSVGSQCSAHSALSGFSHASRVSRLSVVSGVSRSPSPHKMLLETSFCGPKPIETDPEICAAAVEERLLEIAEMSSVAPPPVDARDHREVRTEVTVESAGARQPAAPVTPPVCPRVAVAPALIPPAPASPPTPSPVDPPLDDDKRIKETRNRARVEERRARPRVRREPSEPEVYKSENLSRDVIRIRLKPEMEYEDNEEETELTATSAVGGGSASARKPDSLAIERAARPASTPTPTAPTPLATPSRDPPHSSPARRSPSPAGPVVSRKSSFCSLFKSRETIASPDSPSDALRRKRSLTEGRSRSKSRDRSATPTSATKIRGSVLSLFRTPKRGATSPSPSSRDGSPVVQPLPQRHLAPATAQPPPDRIRRGERLKYYEDAKDGIIHIPLRTPPDERPGSSGTRREVEAEVTAAGPPRPRETARPASAPQPRIVPDTASTSSTTTRPTSKPIRRTVLPDGSIIIPLRSPTEKTVECEFSGPTTAIIESTTASKLIEPSSEPASSPVGRAAADGAEASPSGELDDDRTTVAPVARIDNPPAPTPAADDGRLGRKERLVFTTHVGSREQVFSTQFSITKTPSVTSEISGSFPSFVDGDALRDTHITGEAVESPGGTSGGGSEAAAADRSPQETAARDSSESEPSSEAAPARSGNDVERRGLVVQESFEEELPYVPTTLPLERSVALPMVPVRERGGVRVSGVERPRAAGAGSGVGAGSAPISRAPVPRAPPPAPVPSPAQPALGDKLRIRLPRRARTASLASPAPALPDRISRPRTRSGGDGAETRPKPEWIDFEEVPERRKQPKRIQTLPAGAESGAGDSAGPGSGGVVFSYVEPDQCRCECHAHARHDGDDQLPLLQDDLHQLTVSTSSLECAEDEARVHIARPFTADLDLHPEERADRVT